MPETKHQKREIIDLNDLPDGALLNGREVAAWLGIDVRSLERMRREKVLPFIKVTPKLCRYPVGDLRRWIAERGEAA